MLFLLNVLSCELSQVTCEFVLFVVGMLGLFSNGISTLHYALTTQVCLLLTVSISHKLTP